MCNIKKNMKSSLDSWFWPRSFHVLIRVFICIPVMLCFVCAMLPVSLLHVLLASCSFWFWSVLPPAHLWLISSATAFKLGPVDYSCLELSRHWPHCLAHVRVLWCLACFQTLGLLLLIVLEFVFLGFLPLWIFGLFTLSGLRVPNIRVQLLFSGYCLF